MFPVSHVSPKVIQSCKENLTPRECFFRAGWKISTSTSLLPRERGRKAIDSRDYQIKDLSRHFGSLYIASPRLFERVTMNSGRECLIRSWPSRGTRVRAEKRSDNESDEKKADLVECDCKRDSRSMRCRVAIGVVWFCSSMLDFYFLRSWSFQLCEKEAQELVDSRFYGSLFCWVGVQTEIFRIWLENVCKER